MSAQDIVPYAQISTALVVAAALGVARGIFVEGSVEFSFAAAVK